MTAQYSEWFGQHRGKTYAHASISAFPVLHRFAHVVRLAVFQLVAVNQQPQIKEERTTNTKKVCRQ